MANKSTKNCANETQFKQYLRIRESVILDNSDAAEEWEEHDCIGCGEVADKSLTNLKNSYKKCHKKLINENIKNIY